MKQIIQFGMCILCCLMSLGTVAAQENTSSKKDKSSSDVPTAPEDGGPRNWQVTKSAAPVEIKEQANESASKIADLKAGALLDNLGCQRVEAQIWCDVQPLGGGPRGFVALTHLSPAVAPDGSVPRGPDDSALRAGQGSFDATGPLPCMMGPNQPEKQCEFGVARAGGGYATVVIKKPDERKRAIFFRMGKAVGADTSEADPGEFSVTREGDMNRVQIGPERYTIPDAVIFGG